MKEKNIQTDVVYNQYFLTITGWYIWLKEPLRTVHGNMKIAGFTLCASYFYSHYDNIEASYLRLH
jgi:hypothetical protein